ncbi:MAG: replication factor C large subunit [Candidatus Helarchaeota archaeon]
MEEKELWTVKYAPKKESDIVGNPKAVKEIKEFIQNWSPGNEIKALLLLGPPGCGKTTSTHLLAKLNNFDIIEINASNVRNKKSIEETIMPAITTRSIVENRKKLYLIDEVDGLSGTQDRGGLSAMLKAVRVSLFPIIFTANNIQDKKFRAFKNKDSQIKIVKFQKIREPTIIRVLQKICKAENIKADPKALQEIAINANNDLRSAINDLQAIAQGKSVLTLEDVRELQSVRDVERNIFEVLKIIFSVKDIRTCNEAVSSLDIDWGMLLQWVNESLPYHKASIEAIHNAYKALAKADRIYNFIKSNPEKISWSMLPYFIDLISSGVTIPIKNEGAFHRVPYYKNAPSFYFQSLGVYSSGALMDIINKIKAKLKCNSMDILTKHIPYLALMFLKSTPESKKLAEFFELDKREITLLKKYAK